MPEDWSFSDDLQRIFLSRWSLAGRAGCAGCAGAIMLMLVDMHAQGEKFGYFEVHWRFSEHRPGRMATNVTVSEYYFEKHERQVSSQNR